MNEDRQTIRPISSDLDLGHNHFARYFEETGSLWIFHPCSKYGDAECGHQLAVINTRGPHACTWTLESVKPLTLSPSIRFMCCDDHGFIRGGKWVPAG